MRLWGSRVDPVHAGAGVDAEGGEQVHPAREAQSKAVSLLESVVNVASGFALSLLLWQFVLAPWFGYEVTIVDNLQLTSVFTTVSIARGYLWRRFFERGLHKWLARRFHK